MRSYETQRYSTDPVFRSRKIKYGIQRYCTELDFRRKQQTFMKNYGTQRYSTDPEFCARKLNKGLKDMILNNVKRRLCQSKTSQTENPTIPYCEVKPAC